MTTQNLEQQATAYQKQAAQAGLSGTIYILSCPSEGWLRVQLRDVSLPQAMAQIIQSFQQTLAMGSAMMNLQIKLKTREAEEK